MVLVSMVQHLDLSNSRLLVTIVTMDMSQNWEPQNLYIRLKVCLIPMYTDIQIDQNVLFKRF